MRSVNELVNDYTVLDFVFCSTDVFNYEVKTTEYGRRRYIERSFDYANDKKEIVQDEITRWYKGKWIVNTDFVYDYGLVADQPVKPNQLNETMSPYTFYEMPEGSIIESMIPFANMAQVAWLKLQEVVANSVPAGPAVNIRSLMQVPDGKGGYFDPMKVFGIYQHKGTWFYSDRDAADETIQNP